MMKLLLRTYEKVKGAGDYQLEVKSCPDVEITPERLLFWIRDLMNKHEMLTGGSISPADIQKALEKI